MRMHAGRIRLAPTDLGNYLGCRHLARLELDAALGRAVRPHRFNDYLEQLQRRGLEHERGVVAHLKARGLSVSEPATLDVDEQADEPASVGKDRTLAAMRAGVDVIYQAALLDARWAGRADFLLKVDMSSGLGSWSYEALDAKLARQTRAGALLQLCVYSHLLQAAQGRLPIWMGIVRPGDAFEPQRYRVDDYGAYYRFLCRKIDGFLAEPSDTYPEPVSHCDVCTWWPRCDERRRTDDHLGYVAGIRTSQMRTLTEMDITRLEALALLADVPRPKRGSREALVRVRDQARVQRDGRNLGAPVHELLAPIDSSHGLAMLPAPTPDDIFLDFEGSHFAESGVQEYLTGYVAPGTDGPSYTPLWARTMAEEKASVEAFIDLAIAMRRRNPGAHIYHYAPYEPTALKRLVGRYATREVELDELLRGATFVDLHAVVRRSLIASVERYSIKDLEPFFGYARAQDLREASLSRRLVEAAIEDGDLDESMAAHREIVERYNREDCESASRLRDWLEQLRAKAVSEGYDLPRPEPQDGAASPEIGALDRDLQRLRDALLEGVPADPSDRTVDQTARFTLAHLMEFHRREDKAAWWEYFRLLGLDPEDRADERRSLTDMTFTEMVTNARAPVHRYRFPQQELDARVGDDAYDPDGDIVGSVEAVDFAGCTIDIKKRVRTAGNHPSAVLFHSFVRSDPLRESLMRLGRAVLDNGLAPQPPYEASLRLLQRECTLADSDCGALQQPGESTLQAACRVAASLNGQVLAIQGPPGTGKTYTGAHVICALKRLGLKVGVTAVSHKVIQNLLQGAMRQAAGEGLDLRAAHKTGGGYPANTTVRCVDDNGMVRAGLADGSIDLLGATAWCWSRPEFAQSVDVLVVDEAGQMSLANVLATAQAGRSLILLGDPQQLEQPLQSSHPEGSEVSALQHWLQGHETMPPDRGLFLAETYRLHPEIARFTSEVYYETKLEAVEGCERQVIIAREGQDCALTGSGLRFIEVAHQGNPARSIEEATAIANLVRELLGKADWTNADGSRAPITENDILVVAPYNAQVAALAEAMPNMRERIGTVDRFQGQEAAVVIYSMTTSSPEDAPRGMDFLYDPHRFNVATSRARAMCVLVGNQPLFEPECRNPKQMRMANGFCRYLEMAQTVVLE